LIADKKVCGILAEMDAEIDVVNFVNIGIGINANNSIHQFEKMATSLSEALGREISRKEFLSALLVEMERWQPLLMKADLLLEWKKLSATLNKDVRIEAPSEVITGRAIDVDTTGALIIKDNDGSSKKAIAGDCIHLREETTNTDLGTVSSQHSL
jgi:BirA family biotin operon repressor/biotin-[acetyl-CoA-carboxylase] ligase